jgi:hypothetical protein
MEKKMSNVKTVDDFVIEKNVPRVKSFRSRPGRWQKILQAMEIEDSFLIDETDDNGMKQMNAIRAAANSLGFKVKGIKESEDSRRVYRTA